MSLHLTLKSVLPSMLQVCGVAHSLVPRRVIPPLWREVGVGTLLLGMLSEGSGQAQPRQADGPPVMLVPGLFAGDASLAPLADNLRDHGWAVYSSGIRSNIGCSAALVQQLVTQLEAIAAEHGARVALVGHSRGGLLARATAQQRPDLVSGVVTLGSPHRDQLAVHPLLWVNVMTLLALGSLGVPGLMRFGCCGAEACCRDYEADVAAQLPTGVDAISLFSRNDGVVDWRACVDPDGANVEVDATHCAMPNDPATMRTVVSALARFPGCADDEAFADLEPLALSAPA